MKEKNIQAETNRVLSEMGQLAIQIKTHEQQAKDKSLKYDLLNAQAVQLMQLQKTGYELTNKESDKKEPAENEAEQNNEGKT